MNFAQLDYFRGLIEFGSFSKAAQALGVSQPALSLQIQKLEDELEFQLVDRTRRPLELTDEGLVFYQKTLHILQEVEQLKDIVLELSDETKGELKVGIIPTLSPYLVPLFFQRLKDDYPEFYIDVYELKTEVILDRLKRGQLDCGILATPISEQNFRIDPLFYERFFAYVSDRHELYGSKAIDVSAIDELDIWYLEEGNCFQNQVNSICNIVPRTDKERHLTYHCNSIDSLRHIVEYRHGITFVPELATINIPAEQEEMIKELKGQYPVREISTVVLKHYPKQRLVDALSKIVQLSVPKRMLTKPAAWVVDTKV